MKKEIICSALCIMVVFLSCHDRETSELGRPKEQIKIAGDYSPHQFVSDNRMEKISSIIPELDRIYEEHMAEHKIPGMVYGIVVDDSLVYTAHKGWSDVDKKMAVAKSTAFRIASMTKSFTAMAILKLRDEGLLSLEDPVQDHVPEMSNFQYPTNDAALMDIENLLTMTSGLPEDNPWGDRQLDIHAVDFKEMVNNGLSFSKVPSFQFEYSNTGYALLGLIITKVSGQPYQEYISEHILKPLGMNHTYWDYTDYDNDLLALGYSLKNDELVREDFLGDGAFGAMAGLITTIEDFSKYISFHLDAWPARNGDQTGPIGRGTLREMHRPQYNFLNSWSRDWDGEACASMVGYGYGLGISMDCKRIIKVGHSGALPGFASDFTFYPEYGIGIMAFGNLTYTSPLPTEKIERKIFGELGLSKRKLPTSQILKDRKGDLLVFFENGTVKENRNAFAGNFFLDRDLKSWMTEIDTFRKDAGDIIEIGEVRARNQLRGDFNIEYENGTLNVFYTLSPESNPKIQYLELDYKAN